MIIRCTPLLVAFSALLVFSSAPGRAASESDWSDWDLEERVSAVSDGDLRFLPEGVPADAHIHQNRIRIRPESFETGWVVLDQCHDNLDSVPAVQIAFNAERIRNIRVTRVENVGRAWVDGHTVQLADVEAEARLCLTAESRALHELGGGRYRLRNGPYIRRFLDGYYPMRLLLEVEYPIEGIHFAGVRPHRQPGFTVHAVSGRLSIDASFEGRLFTCVDFSKTEVDRQESSAMLCSED